MISEYTIVWLGKGNMHLAAIALEEAVKSEQSKTYELEHQYMEKMAKHGVS